MQRCALKALEERLADPAPGKRLCDSLAVDKHGVYELQPGAGLFGSSLQRRDKNTYRDKLLTEKKISAVKHLDRAVSIATVAAYDDLRLELPTANVANGDCGENFVLDFPPAQLSVGTKLQLGAKVVVQIAEENKPCLKLNNLAWAGHAAHRWPQKNKYWWKDAACPLNDRGGRGWLARVLTTGVVRQGDVVTVI